MILGIGTDIIEIERIKQAMTNTHFCSRFFTDKENEYFQECGYRPQTVAGNFCAKEAFSKALGTGVRGFSLKDIEVLRDALGKPYILFQQEHACRIHVSISHSREYAVAQVVLEQEEKK